MVKTSCHLLDCWYVFHQDWFIQLKIPLELRSFSAKVIWFLRGLFLDWVYPQLAFFTHNEHSAPSEDNLAYFCFRRQCGNLGQFSVAIWNLFNFYASHFCFFTNVKLTVHVYIRLVVPAKRDINYVWVGSAFERSNLFWSKVWEFLRCIDLSSFTPYIAISVNFFHVFDFLIWSPTLCR